MRASGIENERYRHLLPCLAVRIPVQFLCNMGAGRAASNLPAEEISMKPQVLLVSALAAGAAFSLAAPLGPTAEAQSPAMLRVVHMAPGAPNVDVTVNGQRAIANLAFKAASDYAALPAGSYNAKVTPAGQAQPVVIDANLNLTAGQNSTVVATGELPNIQPLVLQDNNTPPPAGQAKVRFVHASPDAPAVDIAAQGGPVLFRNVAFRTAGEYVNVPAGTYTLEVRPASQTNAVLTVPNVALSAGQNVTVFAAGKAGDGSLAAVPVAYPTAGAAGMPRTGAGTSAASESLGLLAAAALVLLGSGAVVARVTAGRRRG